MWRTVFLVLIAGCSFSPGKISTIDAAPVDGSLNPDGPQDAGGDSADTDAATCPGTYMILSGSRYRYVLSTVTWEVAEQDCEDDGVGTHLVVFADGGESLVVDALTSASQTWMGASDRVTLGTWLYVTGGSAPDLGLSSEARCARWYDGTGGGSKALQEGRCTDTAKAYVCECDLVEPDPSAF